MTKFKKAAISVLTAAALACSVIGAAACGGNYADFINPSSGNPGTPGTPVTPGKEGYTVYVKSEGGLSLNGVMIHAKKDGVTVATGYSTNGKIQFYIPEGKYELVIDGENLPAGYYLPEGKQFFTPDSGTETTVYLPSKIIETTVNNGVTYSAGQVMNTFSFVDTDDQRHSLTEIAQGKKLVVLNFWATWCNPCKSEFPALNEAYQQYSDVVEIVALSTEESDTSAVIKKFYSDYNLSFYMGSDSTKLYNHFVSEGIPLTIFVDRYGVIAYIHNGSITSAATWAGMFATYTSDNYVQNPDNGSQGGEGDVIEMAKPDVSAPDPAVVANAALSSSTTEGKFTDFGEDMSESDKEYNWPWITESEGDRVYLKAANAGKKYSYAMFTANLSMKSGDILSYDYKLNINAVNGDVMAVILDGYPIAQYTGSTFQKADDKENTGTLDGWKTENRAYVATRDIEVKLVVAYQRFSSSNPIENEVAAIDNLKVVHASQANISVDIPLALVSGDLQENGKYESYPEVEYNETDGFYHDKATGNLLFVDIENGTLWSDHVSGKTFTASDNVERTSSLWNISYHTMSNQAQVNNETIFLLFDYGHTDLLLENHYLQMFSDNGYLPVTEKLKQAIIAFTERYCDVNSKDYYENQWLEFCYTFKHYGNAHLAGDKCYETADPTEARGMHNAYTAVENTTVNVEINHASKYNGGGLYYKFTPQNSGVYKFTSFNNEYLDDNNAPVTTDPALMVLASDGTELHFFDEDNTYDNIFGSFNFVGYCYLEGGKTYYLQAGMSYVGSMGKYSFKAENIGATYDQLRTCSTGQGLTDAITNEYMAIKTTFGSDGYYHHLEDGKAKSVIYLDFTHQNFFDQNGHSVYEMVQNSMFDLSRVIGIDFTADMLDYYNKSIEGKDPSDELYGMIEVDQQLSEILVYFCMANGAEGDGRGSNLWLSMCCYYQHYSAPQA